MVKCSKCGKPATRQAAENIDGRLVYMSLCDECHNELLKRTKHTSLLNQFSRDLTKLAEDDKLDPVIGRENEILRLIHILSRRTKNNPVLIGEPGVGKTAIVEGLAQRMVAEKVPEPLRDKRVVSLDLASLIAGTVHRGAFEKRLKEVIEEIVKSQGQIIVFIDEIHTIVGAGASQGSLDASNILKPYLARGELRVIGATTLKEFRVIEKDAALERRFQQILVEEPSAEDTIKILEGLRSRYEEHHQIRIGDEAIKASVKLSRRYISDKFLPDKAIDLIDESGAALKLELSAKEPSNLKEVVSQIEEIEQKIKNTENSDEMTKYQKQLDSLRNVKKELTELWMKTKLEHIPVLMPEHVAAVISTSTGIPLSELTIDERKKLQGLGDELEKMVVGQNHAIKVVSNAIKRARAGVKHVNRPIGAFMFLGPTGVGKTELAKALAKSLYGSEDYLIRVDMSEFNEKHNVSRLIGAPPGYVGYDEGGQLTERVRRKPFSVVLFDEIEKAHPEVFNTLLQVLDDGRLTDGNGRVVDFKNTILIMTSNVGSEFLNASSIGFSGVMADGKVTSHDKYVEEAYERIKTRLEDSLKLSFKPEFLNRMDDIITFKPLSQKDVEKILKIQTNELQDILKDNKIEISLTNKAQKYLVENGYNIEMGARPLKRLIQKEVEDKISDLIIEGKVKFGDHLKIDYKDDQIYIKITQQVTVDA